MKCPECGAVTDNIEGPTHEYMISSPGCWKTFGDVLNKEYSDPGYMKVHRLTVDAYACQHVGDDDPRAKQSVIVHLLALCLAIELKIESSKIPPIMDKVIKENKDKFPKLIRPNFDHTLKVTDIVLAQSPEKHCSLVTEWANQVWQAWQSEHGRIYEIAKTFGGRI